MCLNGLYVKQQGQYYAILTPQGIQVGLLFMGNDGQYMLDAEVMKAVTKIMGRRWGIHAKQN